MTGSAAVDHLVEVITGDLGLPPGPVAIQGRSTLAAAHPVSALSTAAFGVLGVAVGQLQRLRHQPWGEVVVHRMLADTWYGRQVLALDRPFPPVWDPVAGDYRTADGWIRLHTNAPRHRAACLAVLGVPADREAVAAAVVDRSTLELETAVVGAGGAAAELRSAASWTTHPQGRAVATEPVVATTIGTPWTGGPRPGTERQPLAGVRVLDLTRVLAGPTATQLLAALGADVLRIDPPDWDEPGVLPLVMWNKLSARLDARTAAGAARLRDLLSGADVLVHGYRVGALDRLGLDEAARSQLRPGLVEVSLNAYGHTGPWAGRRGFDSLVQFSSGITDTETRAARSATPTSLPVQALDFATGQLAAAAAVVGLTRRERDGVGSHARLSLARTALLLQRAAAQKDRRPRSERKALPVPREVHDTGWGRVALAQLPVQQRGARLQLDELAVPLGLDDPGWP